MEDLILTMNDDGTWEKYDPYAEVSFMTKEDYESFEESLALANAVREAFKTRFIFEKAGEPAVSSTKELIDWFNGLKHEDN